MPDIFISEVNKGERVPENPSIPSSQEQSSEVSQTTQKTKVDLSKLDYDHKTKNHALSAYCFMPDNIDFLNRDPEEHIVLLLRKHPITNVPSSVITFLMIIAPGILSVLDIVQSLPNSFQWILLIIWYMITTAFVLEQFLSWFFHVTLITDERIIEIDFLHLLYREMTDANLDQIQDVTVEMGGLVRTFLNYGDVIVQTAGEQVKLRLEAVPHPDNVAKILRQLRLEEQQEALEGRVR